MSKFGRKLREFLGEEDTLEKPQSGFNYKAMSFMFKIRDLVKPRGKILDEVGIKPGFRVLDFGCGPGGYILPLARLVGESGKIFALDMNPAALLTVKSLAADHKLPNVQTILSDCATGLPDAVIDVALLYDLLHYLKNPDRVLAELHRVLVPGGILSVTDHHMKAQDINAVVSATSLFRLSQKGKVFNFSVTS